jgi:hypothetical protein
MCLQSFVFSKGACAHLRKLSERLHNNFQPLENLFSGLEKPFLHRENPCSRLENGF